MNTLIRSNCKWLIPASMLVAPLAFGIEGQDDLAAPPQIQDKQKLEAEAMPIEEVAYIGLVTGPIPELLSIHLGVRDGEGVLVRSVMPKGPAETAGIRANDLVISVDGKIALSPAELGNIIRSHKPGDKVKVGVIQAGKGTEIEVTLGARPDQMAQLRNGGAGQNGLRIEGMPEDMAERLRDMIQGDIMQLQFDGPGRQLGQLGLEIPDIQRDMKQMREEMKQLREQQQDLLQGDLPQGFQANTKIRLMDDKGSVELSTENGESKLTVRDKDNEIEWEGPWNTDEDKAKAPEEIRERAGNLKMEGGGLKFNFGR